MSLPFNEWQWLLHYCQACSWFSVAYLPFMFRLAAFLTAFPFALFIALDAIAYGIARTLHLSMSQRRVPRSPLSNSSQALALSDGAYDGVGSGYAFDIPTPSDAEDDRPNPIQCEELSARLLDLPSNPPSSSGQRKFETTNTDPPPSSLHSAKT